MNENNKKVQIKGCKGEEIITFEEPLNIVLNKKKNKTIKNILNIIEASYGIKNPYMHKVRSVILDEINLLYLDFCDILGGMENHDNKS